MATQDNRKQRLEDLLSLYENLSMENQEKFLLTFINDSWKILAKSGREEVLMNDVGSQYVSLLNGGKLQGGDVVMDFKRDMNKFFHIEDQIPHSHTVGRSGNHDIKAQLINSIDYTVDAGPAPTGRPGNHSTKLDIKAQSMNSNQYASGGGPARYVAPGTPPLGEARKEIMSLKQEVGKLRQQCEHNRSLKSDNEKLMQENTMLRKEYDKLNQLAKKNIEIIRNFEVRVNENYETEMALKEQLKQLEKVKTEFGVQMKENEDLKRQKEKLNKNIEMVFYEKMEVEKQYEDAKKYIKRKIAEHEDTMKQEKRKNEDELKKILTERDDLLDRFSNLTGSKLTDPNRPMKLSERFGGLYDDQWTDAFEWLKGGKRKMPVKDAISLLLDVLRKCEEFCYKLKETQMDSLRNVLLYPAQDVTSFGSEPRKHVGGLKGRIKTADQKAVRELRRQIGVNESVLEEVKQVFVLETKSWSEKKYLDGCLTYIQKCAEICWLMVLHDPPLYMKMDVKPGDTLDPNLYSVYSASGNKIDFLVWPPLFNEKDGGLLLKGTAETTKVVKRP